MEVHLKVKKARVDAGISQTDFAKKIGTSQNDVWRMENGDKKFVSRPYIDFMLEEGYDLNTLFDNNLSLQKRTQQQAFKPNNNDDIEKSKLEKNKYIPLLPDSFLKNFTYLLYHQEESVPTDYLTIASSFQNSFQSQGAIRVQVDSMCPYLKLNDIIFFSKHPINKEDLLYGEIYLISYKIGQQEIVSLTRLQQADGDAEYVKLVYDNPKLQSKEIPLKKIQAMARVEASIVFNSSIFWENGQL